MSAGFATTQGLASPGARLQTCVTLASALQQSYWEVAQQVGLSPVTRTEKPAQEHVTMCMQCHDNNLQICQPTLGQD